MRSRLQLVEVIEPDQVATRERGNVERTTRFTMLLHLPPMEGHGQLPRAKNGPPLAGHGAEAVRNEIARVIATLPANFDDHSPGTRGAEMAQHAQLRIDTDFVATWTRMAGSTR